MTLTTTLPLTDSETGHRLDFLLVADMVEPGSRVLDVGCGDGSLLAILRDRRGVDGRESMIPTHGIPLMRRAAAELRDSLEARWPLLVQGEGSRDQLLRRFRDAGNAILLGTDSFWEGVDVPGRALRALVLHKLPFKVPSEPITAARLERLSEQGMDGFSSYLLPHAALKLKQGFGRLIRSQRDHGLVVILDPRVRTKPYGRVFLESLPDCRHSIDRVHADDAVSG